MDATMDACMDATMDACMDATMDACMDATMDACMDACMDGGVDDLWTARGRHADGTISRYLVRVESSRSFIVDDSSV